MVGRMHVRVHTPEQQQVAVHDDALALRRDGRHRLGGEVDDGGRVEARAPAAAATARTHAVCNGLRGARRTECTRGGG